MTFKHADASNSSIYRALEKVAYEKGLVKPDPISKTASKKKTDLKPEKNLVANILKLCSALREEGLDRQASEIEQGLLIYKAAASKASPDVDPEVIRAAHPQGSVRVSNIDGDALVEDILDQHVKSLYVALKEPTGKISTASQIISEVKLALGQEVTPSNSLKLEDFSNEITSLSENFRKIINGARWSLGWGPTSWRTAMEMINMAHQALVANDPITVADGRIFQKKIYEVFNKFKYLGGFTNTGKTLSVDETLDYQENIKKLNRLINKYDTGTTKVEKDLGAPISQDTPEITPPVMKQPEEGLGRMIDRKLVKKKLSPSQLSFTQKHSESVKTLSGWYNKIKFGKEFDPQDTTKALDWIGKKAKALADVKKDFETALSQTAPDEIEEMSKTMLTRLMKIVIAEPGSFESFRKVWIG